MSPVLLISKWPSLSLSTKWSDTKTHMCLKYSFDGGDIDGDNHVSVGGVVVVEGHPFDDDDEQQTSDRLRAFGVYRQHAADPTCDNQPLPASRNTNIFCLKNAISDGFGFDQCCPSCIDDNIF